MADNQIDILPLGSRVVIEEYQPPSVTEGGVLLSRGALNQFKKPVGTIVACGPGEFMGYGEKPNAPMPVKVGDIVLFSKFSGSEIDLNGKTYHIMNVEHVFAILPKGYATVTTTRCEPIADDHEPAWVSE
jgi:chaperonin GroES